MDQKDYIDLANQLKCPNGDQGVVIANTMFVSNNNMIFKTIDRLDIQECDTVLEFGFGSGKHLQYLFSKAENILYEGIEASSLMIETASELNKDLVVNKKVSLKLADDSCKLDYPNKSFNHCFAVNTIYFWPDPVKYLQEIFRVLKPNGNIALAYIREDFAQKQPFAVDDIFEFHKTERLIRVITNIGYSNVEQWQYMENTIDKTGKKVVRPFVILKGNK
ncbi:class I SAM-dependent methyltransferase [Myroides injenensis]|uniref:class I SAM-dependent methyltransferase n=1 Tax=Myroides injenensis TaxID=1183151 RepID=UPI0002894677|nr:class I SAM-dependent methyltransferase [Myroides injenensis]